MGKRSRSNLASSSSNSIGLDSKSSRIVAGSSNNNASTSSPVPKRLRTKESARIRFTLEGSLSEEIIRNCLSFLEADDLAILSRVSSSWYRLSKDPDLWRRLYLTTFTSNSSNLNSNSNGFSSTYRTRPWREMFKVSQNWRRGQVRTNTITRSVRGAVLAKLPIDLSLNDSENETEEKLLSDSQDNNSGVGSLVNEGAKKESDTLLQFYKNWIFTATRTLDPLTLNPTVLLHQTLPSGSSTLTGTIFTSSITSPATITELRLDELTPVNPHSLRLAIFYSTGQFSIFQIQLPTTSTEFSTRELYLSPLSIIPRYPADAIVLAKMYGPLLVTCSISFSIRFWRIEELKDGQIKVEVSYQTLKSMETWFPVVLSLSPVLETPILVEEEEWVTPVISSASVPNKFKVTLAYSTPVFPSSFSVGVQEFNITVPITTSTNKSLNITTRHATAPSFRPHNFSNSNSIRNRLLSPPISSPITSIEFSNPFIVTSRSDNVIDVFKLTSPLLEEGKLKLVHHKSLFGHTSSVETVAISTVSSGNSNIENTGSGRMVSGGIDGRFKVWDLGNGIEDDEEQVEKNKLDQVVTIVEEADQLEMNSSSSSNLVDDEAVESGLTDWKDLMKEFGTEKKERIRKVWFDEEKIVSLIEEKDGSERVRVLRFD